MSLTLEKVKAAVFGHAVGDALGVPVEFTSRERLKRHPVTDMLSHGTHNQPAGTWSDDASLTLCLMESLCAGFDLADQAKWFRRWLFENVWTPHGDVFDVGNTTACAIRRSREVADPRLAGPRSQSSNGNGSLMRLLPLGLWLAGAPRNDRVSLAMDASCLTHGHIRSQLACAIYVELVARLVNGEAFSAAVAETQDAFAELIESTYFDERLAFTVVLDADLASYPEEDISGSGYVIHTLGASLWCCLRAQSYEEAVLMAVNLGEDTDTTGAVTGALAGLIYGYEAVPSRWVSQLARRDEIEALCERFASCALDAGVIEQ